MVNYRIAKPEDMDGVIDFINMVFSMLRVPHNFERMLPKVYGRPFRLADIHVIAEEEDGRLCGCLGMYVFPLRVGKRTLRVGYLGSMAVHPRVRGQGTMGTLMSKQIERGQALGLDMMVLGGQRQRYQYSGFETGGATYLYSISRSNVRHALADADDTGLTFRPMTASDTEAAMAMYDSRIVAGARTPENFLATLVSYEREAFAAEKNGELVGYLSAEKDGMHIGELVMRDSALILPAIKAWVNSRGIVRTHIAAAPYDVTLNRLLAPVCEGFSIEPNCMVRVLHPETVLQAYMELKHAMTPLADGRMLLGWEGLGTYALSVCGGCISVAAAQEAPEQVFSGIDVHQLLFGYNRFNAPRNSAPSGWFPLPLHIPEPDSF